MIMNGNPVDWRGKDGDISTDIAVKVKDDVGAGLRPFRRSFGVRYPGALFRWSVTRFTPLIAPSSAPPIRMIDAPEGNSMK